MPLTGIGLLVVSVEKTIEEVTGLEDGRLWVVAAGRFRVGVRSLLQ